MASEQTTYKHFFIYTLLPVENLLKKDAELATRQIDYTRGPYLYVSMKKKMTVKKLMSILGDESITVEPQNDLVEITRCEIAKAKHEYDELLKRGQIIVDVLNEDNTPEEVLNAADRRAVKAYRRSL